MIKNLPVSAGDLSSIHFRLLIPRMSMFTLAISCLTTSNLPGFMDLTFQVPMRYCSLQHWILLLSPVTSTTGYSFCFGSISSFFLESFLHFSPVEYWAPTNQTDHMDHSLVKLKETMSHAVYGHPRQMGHGGES